jgi:hypothetical protein
MATTVPFQVRALYPFATGEDLELEFSEDQIITITSQGEDGWYQGEYVTSTGETRRGLVPSNFVESYENADYGSNAPSSSANSTPDHNPFPTTHSTLETTRSLPDGSRIWPAELLTAIQNLKPLSTTLLPSSVGTETINNTQSTHGDRNQPLLFEDDESLKAWYRNLDLDSKATDGSENSEAMDGNVNATVQKVPQRDSGIGLQSVDVSARNEGALDTKTITEQTTSDSQLPLDSLHILSNLRTTLRIPRYTAVPPLDWELGFSTEIYDIESFIISNLESKASISPDIQSSLVGRLERVIISSRKSRGQEDSESLTQLDQKCTILANKLVLLLNAKKNCIVCGNERSVHIFGKKITDNCNHVTNTCRHCLERWISSQIIDKGWDKVQCSECPEMLQHEDIREHATPESFER